MIALITILSLIGGVFVFQIQQTNAGGMLLYFLKEFIVLPLVRKIANALENKLLNRTSGLLSGLVQKTPSFIISWRNFTLDSQARGNDIFRAVLADASLCPYLKTNLQQAFGADRAIGVLTGSGVKVGTVTVFQQKTNITGLPSFQNLANCSLPPTFNLNTFKNDFAAGGGWATWNKLIQPQNNFFGAYSLALGEQQKQITTELQSSRDKSIAGQGFLSQQLGSNGAASPAGCVGASLPGVQRFTLDTNGDLTNTTRCAFLGKEVTPAKVLGHVAAKTIDTKLSRIGGATQITDILLNLLTSLMSNLGNRILNFMSQGSYQAPPPYQPTSTPTGGPTLGETPFEPGGNSADPNLPNDPNVGTGTKSDPNFACTNACQGELDNCRSGIITVCTTGPIDPLTGQPGPDVCGPDPNGDAQCRQAHSSCTSQCNTLP